MFQCLTGHMCLPKCVSWYLTTLGLTSSTSNTKSFALLNLARCVSLGMEKIESHVADFDDFEWRFNGHVAWVLVNSNLALPLQCLLITKAKPSSSMELGKPKNGILRPYFKRICSIALVCLYAIDGLEVLLLWSFFLDEGRYSMYTGSFGRGVGPHECLWISFV